MSEVARKRLQVIAELTELGSGFKIAARDLEIRGAGICWGRAVGHIAAVGYDLYTQLIQETMRELRGEPAEAEVDPTIRLRRRLYPGILHRGSRVALNLYKRLAAIRESRLLTDFAEELADRFGPAPAEVEWLLKVVDLKIEARRLRIQEIDGRGKRCGCASGRTPR